ncbi:MAG: GGDEF domain-containing protein [Candidatus Omnitrophica bacterium]|nr:GGDEF domain-containing protein [Candidatus Omnitrophota bacterium]MDD5236838.1 GGDEF domain-containing protein [Candidatus Omnitrophota bacterium]MDD5610793.1 GGDEF domain-containing protein [Candidatus Omnitrophota bacterium]
MLYLIGYFILLCFVLYRYIENIFSENIKQATLSLDLTKKDFSRINARIQQLSEDNKGVNKEVEETQTLYELTKDMCRFFDEDKIFNVFKDATGKFVKLKDSQFVKQDKLESLGPEYRLIPLDMENKNLGYLAVNGLSEADEEKFSILTQQYLLAVRRAVLYKGIQELAITDSLTGALSRRYSAERLIEEVDRSNRFKLEFCVLMADIDHFKKYNDQYGHLVGDAVLKEVVGIIKENLRHIDLVSRYGGEEFLMLLPETSKENGTLVAERIRAKIEAHKIYAYDETIQVTISIGVASFPEDSRDVQELTDKADWALYRCKNTGRNRVCAYKVYKE